MTVKQTQVREATALGAVSQSSTPNQHRFQVRIIEGDRWGSSGYYPATVLRTDGPKVFTEGTQMYLNHPSWTDEFDQPERRVQDIIGVLSSDATYDEASKSLTAEATVFSHYASMINEIAPHIGVSIRALATAEEGEMDGQFGDIITGFIKAESVDVVTKAGAGGAILSVVESAFNKASGVVRSASQSRQETTKETGMSDTTISTEQATALTSAMSALTEALVKDQADRKAAQEAANAPKPIDPLAVARALSESGIPAVMHVDVTNAIEAGKSVEEAVRDTKARYDEIVKGARETAGSAPSTFVIGTPQPVGASTMVNEAEKLNRYLLGK